MSPRNDEVANERTTAGSRGEMSPAEEALMRHTFFFFFSFCLDPTAQKISFLVVVFLSLGCCKIVSRKKRNSVSDKNPGRHFSRGRCCSRFYSIVFAEEALRVKPLTRSFGQRKMLIFILFSGTSLWSSFSQEDSKRFSVFEAGQKKKIFCCCQREKNGLLSSWWTAT